jgi:hypothetical protein
LNLNHHLILYGAYRIYEADMTENQELRDSSMLLAIEQAARETPVCVLCASPTIPVALGDEVWLRCIEDQPKRSLLSRLTSLEFAGAHTRRLVVTADRNSAA